MIMVIFLVVNNLRDDFLEWELQFASITIVNVFLQNHVDLICIKQENRIWSIDYVVDQTAPVDLKFSKLSRCKCSNLRIIVIQMSANDVKGNYIKPMQLICAD